MKNIPYAAFKARVWLKEESVKGGDEMMEEKRQRNDLPKTLSFSFKIVVMLLLFLFVQAEGTDQLYAETNTAPVQDSAQYPSTPQKVVEAFCKGDYNGEGLTTFGWRKSHRYTAWSDAPGWDKAIIVSAYKVIDVKEKTNKATIRVRYEVVGELSSGEKMSELKRIIYSENVDYKLAVLKGRWKIKRPQEAPHISANRAVQRLESEMKKENNARLLKQANKNIGYLKKSSEN